MDASASIVLKMRGSARLDRGQVQAVRHLVATAVPGLKPEHISIIDDRGTLSLIRSVYVGQEGETAEPESTEGQSTEAEAGDTEGSTED